MILVKPSFQILARTGRKDLSFNYDESEKLIEFAGRLCYKSEEKITEDSHIKFIEGLLKRGHRSVLEHSWEIRKYEGEDAMHLSENMADALLTSQWLEHRGQEFLFVAGNKRMFVEWIFDMVGEYKDGHHDLASETEIEELDPKMKAMTVKFICDRGVTHELVRHRIASYSQESTRYCNYSGGVTFVIPPWTCFETGEYDADDVMDANTYANIPETIWLRSCLASEINYSVLLREGWKPEQARSVLPNSLKTEIIMTASLQEWEHVFNLRCLGLTGKPHPQMSEIMEPLFEEFCREEKK